MGHRHKEPRPGWHPDGVEHDLGTDDAQFVIRLNRPRQAGRGLLSLIAAYDELHRGLTDDLELLWCLALDTNDDGFEENVAAIKLRQDKLKALRRLIEREVARVDGELPREEAA